MICAVGLEAAVDQYAAAALGSTTTSAYLFYGMGGIGKTTLVTELFQRLATSGLFSGGTFAATINRVFVDDTRCASVVQSAQLELLRAVLGGKEPANCTLVMGCSYLAKALACKQGPVLLEVDNVPEAGRGIWGMLPQDLLTILPAGYVPVLPPPWTPGPSDV
jgi:hypothetical protein